MIFNSSIICVLWIHLEYHTDFHGLRNKEDTFRQLKCLFLKKTNKNLPNMACNRKYKKHVPKNKNNNN